MTCLLDTHAIIWWLEDHPLLGAAARDALTDPSNRMLVSPVSGYEIAYKTHGGKLAVPFQSPGDFALLLRQEDWQEFPLTLHHAVTAGRLPMAHRDPFDRLLAAQAISEGIPLVTNDAALTSFSQLDTLW